jgi:hypothetical protein
VRILLQEGKSEKTCLDIVLLSKAFVRKGCFMTLPAVFAENTLMIQIPYGRIFQCTGNGYGCLSRDYWHSEKQL